MPGAVVRVALFGKLPAHGDFVCRGLDHVACAVHDRWLSQSLEQARNQHGEAFADRYDGALPWRFTLHDEHGSAGGAIALSQDAAGRRFPVYMELRSLAADGPVAAAAAIEGWLYEAIAGRWEADALVAAAAGFAGTVEDGQGTPAGRWWLEGDADASLTGVHPPALIARMLAA